MTSKHTGPRKLIHGINTETKQNNQNKQQRYRITPDIDSKAALNFIEEIKRGKSQKSRLPRRRTIGPI